LISTDAWESSDRSDFTEQEQAQFPSSYSFTRDAFNMGSSASPASLKRLFEYLNSNDCLRWITDISGRACHGFNGSCARYIGGNHLTTHNDYQVFRSLDGSVTTRTVTFNYYLTKNWQSEWGGRFIWEKPYSRVNPGFNKLVMFLVSHDSAHHVEKVSDAATSPRLAVTGWFTTTRAAGSRKLNISRS